MPGLLDITINNDFSADLIPQLPPRRRPSAKDLFPPSNVQPLTKNHARNRKRTINRRKRKRIERDQNRPEVCRDHQRGRCRRGSQCKRLHITAPQKKHQAARERTLREIPPPENLLSIKEIGECFKEKGYSHSIVTQVESVGRHTYCTPALCVGEACQRWHTTRKATAEFLRLYKLVGRKM